LLLFVTLALFTLGAVAADKPSSDADSAKPKEGSKSTDKDKAKARDDAKSAATQKAMPKETQKATPPDKSKGKGASKPTSPAKPLPTGPVAGDAVEFIYFNDVRPLLIRLHVQIDGKPVEETWQESIRELFKYLDRNGDGVLSKDEAEKTPPPQVLLNPNSLYGGVSGVSMSQLDSNHDGKVTLQELTDYYRRSGGGPFHFLTAPAQQQIYFNVFGQQQEQGNMSDQLNDALFALLDTNKDGKLSKEELAAAEKALLTVDTDEDEMVTVEELLPNLNRMNNRRAFVRRRAGGQAGTPNTDFQLINPVDPPAKLTKQLLARYGRKSGNTAHEKLTQKEIGLDQAAFDELDLDKNGELDARELDRFTRRTPDLELIMRNGRGRGIGPLEVMKQKDKPETLASRVKSENGGYKLDLGTTRLELRGSQNGGAYFASAANVRSNYLMQYKSIAASKKGYLELKDVRQNGFLANTFKMMDRDNDGKLTEKEMLEWIDKMTAFQNKATSSCASLSVSDQGRGLFDMIDTSRDSRLSVREMRNAVKLVEQLDRDGDGQISRAEIPRNILLAMGQGPGAANGNFAVPVAINPYGMNQTNRPNVTAGPLWFRKMDLNRDGDVSRREFLGTDEEFDRIDTDHDGLISVQEADAFDRQMRAQKVATKPK
jgi:Ca2+-binding EF-hand superfamily protein